MKGSRTAVRLTVIAAFVLVTVLWNTQAIAGALALTLERYSLENVPDAAGIFQHEGGTIFKGDKDVGSYIIIRRVTHLDSIQGNPRYNSAMTTVTLFFGDPDADDSPTQNVTLMGAHQYNCGHFIGSVSAASKRYNWIQGADAKIIPAAQPGQTTLSLSWPGAKGLTLP